MSTEPGGKAVVEDLVRESRALVEAARGREEQLELLDPLTPEEMAEARLELGAHAGGLAVVEHARAARRGRPKGARNKRSDDFGKYLQQFGQHPAITMMQIQATPTEVLMARSEREKAVVVGKGDNARVVTIIESMTYGEAESLRIRCAEGLLPYIESKKPVAVDMTFSGVADLFIEGVTHSAEEMADIIDADFMALDDNEEDPE